MQNNTYHTLNSIINNKMEKVFVLLGILILYTLCIITSILYIYLIFQSKDVMDNIEDIIDITDFSDIVDTTDIFDYIDYINYIDFDIEDKPIEISILKDQFNRFIDLFSTKISNYSGNKVSDYITDIKSYYDIHITVDKDDIESRKEYSKVDIIKPLLRHNLDSLSKDISDLEDQVSILKVNLQQEKLQNLDVKKHYENTIDCILEDLAQMHNTINRSPKL